MFIKAKNKVLRKYDIDFWNFLYTRRRKNKFFIYFKLSLINKLRFFYNKKLLFLNKNNLLSFILKKNDKLNLRRFFKKSKFFIKKVFFKNIKPKKNKLDMLLGIKSAFERYKKKIKSPLSRLKTHIKQVILFYNNFTIKKLKRLAQLSIHKKIGGLNFFFQILESRLDSIILRLNLGSKFFSRN